MQSETIGLVVNAGGQSVRMGRAKALLPMPSSGTPLVIHILRRLLPQVTGNVVVVTNDQSIAAVVSELPRVLIVRDEWAEGGALGGLATGLAACDGWAMVVACDMPLVSPEIFALLASKVGSQAELDAVIPRVAGQAQPFHGLWHRRALQTLYARLAAGKLAIQEALAELNLLWVDESELGIKADEKAFYNVNTPEEWAGAQDLLAEQERPAV
jgi:molybdenum cofactor guanylyltransferase